MSNSCLRAGHALRQRHPVRGRDQVQLQALIPARMRRAVPVAGPSGRVAALDGLSGGAAGRSPASSAGTGAGAPAAHSRSAAGDARCPRSAAFAPPPGNQLHVGQFPWRPATGQAGGDHMNADLDIQCDQDSIQVRSHSRSWMPAPASRQQGRTSPNQELLTLEGACR